MRDEALVPQHLGETDKTVLLLTRDEALVLQHLGETDKTVLLPTRDEALVPWHLGETDKTILLLTREKALVPQFLGKTDKDCFTPDQGRGSLRTTTPDKIGKNVPPSSEWIGFSRDKTIREFAFWQGNSLLVIKLH